MKETRFNYKGVPVVVQDDHPKGLVIAGERRFEVMHHHSGGLPMWMCDEAYFATPDLMELARHFVDYGYLFDAPGRVLVPGGHGPEHDETPAAGPSGPSGPAAPNHGATGGHDAPAAKSSGQKQTKGA